MKLLCKWIYPLVLFVLLLGPDLQIAQGQSQWHNAYKDGLEAMQRNDWSRAAEYLQKALQTKNRDSKKTRAGGTMFIEYFPHRELGICYFQLGQLDLAKQELTTSLGQAFSERAKSYLDRINNGEPAVATPPPAIINPSTPATPNGNRSEDAAAAMVGDRLSIAVLPFESKGIGSSLGQIDLLDKLITGFVNSNRFKVIERAQLEKILVEQKLGLSGIIDVSTAAQIGKGIGVDGVVCGSITQGGNAVTIDARLIDTETAAIISAKDAYSNSVSLQNLSQMLTDLATKFKADLPILHGYVIGVQSEKVTIDLGHRNGIKKGMRCHAYREGAPIVHPVTNEVIGKQIDELCELQVTDVFDAYALATITRQKSGTPTVRDKIITK